jgi:hypothetical protein
MKHFTLALVSSLVLAGCGGSDIGPHGTPVELCIADLRPAVLACLSPDYRGLVVPQCATELAVNPKVVACRELGIEEFVVLADNAFGHAVRVVLQGTP